MNKISQLKKVSKTMELSKILKSMLICFAAACIWCVSALVMLIYTIATLKSRQD